MDQGFTRTFPRVRGRSPNRRSRVRILPGACGLEPLACQGFFSWKAAQYRAVDDRVRIATCCLPGSFFHELPSLAAGPDRTCVRPRIGSGRGPAGRGHPRAEAPRLGAEVDDGHEDHGGRIGRNSRSSTSTTTWAAARIGSPRPSSTATSPRWTRRACRTVVNLDGGWGDRLAETARGPRQGPPRPVPHVRPGELRGDRRRGLEPSRGRAAGGELPGGGQGAEVPQDASGWATATRTAASCRWMTPSSTRSGSCAPDTSGRS